MAQDATAAWFPQPGVGGGLSPSQSTSSCVNSEVGPHRHHHASRSARMAEARTPYGRAAATTTRAADEVVFVEIDELLARYAPRTDAHHRWAFWTREGYGTYYYNAGDRVWHWFP
ncbi:hypothetical protein C2E23DRAFT_806465 [Lenzites betulinus]|nr:hypothetical protein C2E23DRAFT_806465 [Lenzites betulinus]